MEAVEIYMDEVEEYSGVKLDDDSAILVSNAIEIVKEQIINELGVVS